MGVQQSTRWTLAARLVAFAVVVAVLQPHPLRPDWVLAVLALAPLVLVPVCVRLLIRAELLCEFRCSRCVALVQLGAAICFAWALLLRRTGTTAIVLAVPWAILCVLLAGSHLLRFARRRGGSLAEVCAAAGSVYLVIGGTFGVFHCAGHRPLGFEPIIVLLTAVHFHYAGFLLPALSGLLVRQAPTRLNRFGTLGVVAGMPIVAMGINATQFGFAPWIETSAACLFATCAASIAFGYVRLSLVRGPARWARVLWGVAGVSLAGAMVLAALHGLRFSLPLPYVTIPWMHAVHGTLGAFGFTVPALCAWWIESAKAES